MWVRRIAGVVAGVVVAMATITVVEMAGHLIFPPPPGVDMRDPAQVARVVDVIPAAAKAWVTLSWFLGSLAGAWVALAVARWIVAPWIVAGVVIAGAVASYVMIPHPLWMQAAGVLLPLAAAWIALRLPTGRSVVG